MLKCTPIPSDALEHLLGWDYNKTMYAEIAINVPVRRTFNYHIPPDLDGLIEPGQLVQGAFGTAQQHGIVLRLVEKSGGRSGHYVRAEQGSA